MFSFCYTKKLVLLFAFLWIPFLQHSHSPRRTCILYFTNFSLTSLCGVLRFLFFVMCVANAARRADMVWRGMAWHWNLFATKTKIFNGIFRTTWNEYTIVYIIRAHAHKLCLSVAWKKFSDLSISGDDITRNHAVTTTSPGHILTQVTLLFMYARYWACINFELQSYGCMLRQRFSIETCETCTHTNTFSLDTVIYRFIEMINAPQLDCFACKHTLDAKIRRERERERNSNQLYQIIKIVMRSIYFWSSFWESKWLRIWCDNTYALVIHNRGIGEERSGKLLSANAMDSREYCLAVIQTIQ